MIIENTINWKKKLRTKKEKLPVKIFRILNRDNESFMLGAIKLFNIFCINIWTIEGKYCNLSIINYFDELENY